MLRSRGGLAVSRGNVSELTAALVRLTADSTLRNRMGRSTRDLATRHYAFDDYARSMLALYGSLLQIKGRTDRLAEL